MPPVLLKPIDEVQRRESTGISARPAGAIRGEKEEAMRLATRVVVDGARSGEWSIGGQTMEMEMSRALEEVGR